MVLSLGRIKQNLSVLTCPTCYLRYGQYLFHLIWVYYAQADIFVCALFLIKIWRCFRINDKELLINEEIRDKEIRVIDNDGSQLGIMSARDAQKIANEKNLDLVKIAPNAVPPVCKIMDYGKYKFEQTKREKEARKNQKVVEVKEVRMSLNIDTHDFNTKANNAMKFLKSGDKVKVSVRFRGREMAHTKLGEDLLVRFAEQCSEFGVVEKQPKMEGRSIAMFVSPKSAK